MTNPTITADDDAWIKWALKQPWPVECGKCKSLKAQNPSFPADGLWSQHFLFHDPIDQPAQQDKQTYYLELFSAYNYDFERDHVYAGDLTLTLPAAEALANAIKAVVEYIENPTWDLQQGSHVCEMINAAAMAYEESNK